MDLERRKKVLIVEDERPIRHLFSETPLLSAFEVLEAQNGEEGLKIALKERPDLIVLDLIMPGSGGISTLKELREDAWGKTATVIAWTAFGDDASEREVRNLGVKDFIDKHEWSFNDIAKKIKDLLSKQ